MLEVKHLMVFFENALALNDVNLEINEGEMIGVFGSNSAGKTTLMNSISGLIIDMKTKEARRGGERITLFGEINYEEENIINTQPSYRVKKGIGLSRERHPIFRESDVEENLRIAGYLCNRQQVRERSRRVFRMFPPLKELRHRRAGFLSGGEQQMLAIGMALMTNPRLFLMDEPLLGLSPAIQADLVKAAKEIQKEGVTILVTEQFARPLLPVIDRGYVMENGIIILSGTGQELLKNPEVKAAYFGV
jgi:branched-chain amino acid transport system ATP-binding protein